MIMKYLYQDVLPLVFICKDDYLTKISLLIKLYPNYLFKYSAKIANNLQGFGSFNQIFVSYEQEFYTGLTLLKS